MVYRFTKHSLFYTGLLIDGTSVSIFKKMVNKFTKHSLFKTGLLIDGTNVSKCLQYNLKEISLV